MPDVCRKCSEEGHMARDCPNAEPDKCFKCKQVCVVYIFILILLISILAGGAPRQRL